MKKLFLPKEFYLAELAYIARKLESLPDIRIGKRGNKPTIRFKDSALSHQWKRLNYNSAPQNLKDIAEERLFLTNRQQVLSAIWNTTSITSYQSELSHYKLIAKKGLFNKQFFDSVQDQASPFIESECKKYKHYFINSRAEYVIAQTLDKMGLIFKYDVKITGCERTADFLIYLSAFDCCIILEYFGRMGKQGYMFQTASKISEYLELGCRMNYEFAILTGDKNHMPVEEEIVRVISLCIANLADERLHYVE